MPTPTPVPTPTPGPLTIPLDGTTASGDIDASNAAAHITGTLPGLPDFAGQVLVVDGNAYLRVPGQSIFSTEAASSLPLNPADSSGGVLAEFQTILTTVDDKDLNPKLLGIESRPGGPCYHIQVQAAPDVVSNVLDLTGQGVGYAIVDMWIYQSNFLIEHMDLHTSDPLAGSAAIRLVLSEYNSIAPIVAPAAGQFDPSGLGAPAAT